MSFKEISDNNNAPGSSIDLYRESFKRFKFMKDGPPDLAGNDERILVDFPIRDCEKFIRKSRDNLELDVRNNQHGKFGLTHPTTWKVYDVQHPKGLILIRNPFTPEGQRYWIKRSVEDFPNDKNFITNIDNLEVKEGKRVKSGLDRNQFYKQLRWVTFGYHHDWDTKVYSEDKKSTFPPDLADLTNFMASNLGFDEFKAEAAIANYYHMDSTLSGHVDRSEINQEAPLFSLSFGQSALFLIGGRTKCVKPQAVLLRSGDVAVMSGESRLSYHGVPKIFKCFDNPWETGLRKDKLDSKDLEEKCESPNSKKLRLDSDTFSSNESFPSKEDNNEWSEFLENYVLRSRINLNIRQVLFFGQSLLSSS